MLEFKNIRIHDLKDLTTVVFVIIDDLYKQIADAQMKNHINIDKSILSNSEIITISILGELLSCDSERAWHSFISKNMRDLFLRLCERIRFNRTKRNLNTKENRNKYITVI